MQTHTLDVPEYGTFQVHRRTIDLELMIAVEKDRLLREYVQRNNDINRGSAPLTIADVGDSTTNFFGFLASFTQTVVETPEDFDPHTFLTEWSREEAMDFLQVYLTTLTTLEQSFRRRVDDHAGTPGTESALAADRTSVGSKRRSRNNA